MDKPNTGVRYRHIHRWPPEKSVVKRPQILSDHIVARRRQGVIRSGGRVPDTEDFVQEAGQDNFRTCASG